ncbi:hypothetical protein [Robertmurraya siralis]|uniref:hypothetical protein n=1 Tax=Robertmurraya siralis TaxID=77777 RepID=UPI001476ED37|nr:hypothetical protein [Robertmurraya siralis]
MRIYYLLILIFSFGLMGVFVLLGTSQLVHPFVSITGIIASIVGGVGTCIDWKDKSK